MVSSPNTVVIVESRNRMSNLQARNSKSLTLYASGAIARLARLFRGYSTSFVAVQNVAKPKISIKITKIGSKNGMSLVDATILDAPLPSNV